VLLGPDSRSSVVHYQISITFGPHATKGNGERWSIKGIRGE
jgi:hypothetical protein